MGLEVACGRPPTSRSRVVPPRPGRLVLLALLAAPSLAAARPQAPRAEQTPGRVDYVVEARFDGDTKRLDGSLTVTWTNASGDEVADLWFHLYHNAFANNRSTFLRESKGELKDNEREPVLVTDGWGWQRVLAARLVEGEERVDLLPTLTFEAPDDGNAEDMTVFRLALPDAVAPGATVAVELEWEAQLPRVRRRTGYKDDFVFAAHWFPKLGVYEDGRGWNCHQFHSSSEFYSNFGTYDVTLDLPADYRGDEKDGGLVGASGKLVESGSKGDDRWVVRYQAPAESDRGRLDRTGREPLVHGFTWTADSDFEVYLDTFRYEDWANQEDFRGDVETVRRALGPDKDVKLRNVDVRVLVQPEHAGQAERHFRATCAALFYYGLWYGEYPYERITVVDPAWGGRQAGGMEYPTLFTSGTWMMETEDTHVPESVTVHEAGHQFFYGLVGNNEFEAAWLDEGLNSFTDSEVMHRVYGERRATTKFARIPFDGVRPAALPACGELGEVLTARRIDLPFLETDLEPLRLTGFLELWRDLPGLHFVGQSDDPRWYDRGRYLRAPDVDPIDTPAWEYVDATSYSVNSYSRPAVVLRTLRGLVGEEAFVRGMRHFAETYRYRHPYPDDFFEAFQEGSGVEQDLGWFFADCFRSTKTADWSVTVTQARRAEPMGFFPAEDGELVKLGTEEAAEAEEEESDEPWVIEVELRQRGGLRLPLDVALAFEDGTSQRFVWSREEQGESAWLRRELLSEVKLEAAVLDPDRRYWLDADMSDNQWYAARDCRTPVRWSERTFAQLARYLQWFARFGG